MSRPTNNSPRSSLAAERVTHSEAPCDGFGVDLGWLEARVVDAVIDDADLRRRHAEALDQVAARVIGDGDDLVSRARGTPLRHAQLPGDARCEPPRLEGGEQVVDGDHLPGWRPERQRARRGVEHVAAVARERQGQRHVLPRQGRRAEVSQGDAARHGLIGFRVRHVGVHDDLRGVCGRQLTRQMQRVVDDTRAFAKQVAPVKTDARHPPAPRRKCALARP
jgi:hypothetical protein